MTVVCLSLWVSVRLCMFLLSEINIQQFFHSILWLVNVCVFVYFVQFMALETPNRKPAVYVDKCSTTELYIIHQLKFWFAMCHSVDDFPARIIFQCLLLLLIFCCFFWCSSVVVSSRMVCCKMPQNAMPRTRYDDNKFYNRKLKSHQISVAVHTF